jgi:recombination protein RecT
MSEPSRELARPEPPGKLIEASLGEFAKILPAAVKPEQFGRWALTVIRKGLSDPRQGEAWGRVLDPGNPEGTASVMSALMDAASLGLEPGREYHLVPFGSTVTGITDYKGEIRLMTNYCKSVVVAQLIHAKDCFAMTGANIPPKHDADWFGDRGPVTGGYAYVDYGDDLYSLVVRMRRDPDPSDPDADSFAKHREAAKIKTVWDEWFEAQCLKTLTHQLRKRVPWATERQW